MRYVMFMIPAAYAQPEADVVPSAEMVERMMDFNAQLDEAGVLLALDGLHPPADGVRFTFGDNGPEEAPVSGAGIIGGYWILDVASHEDAVQWARNVPAMPGDVIEVRRIQEAEDFPDDVQDVLEKYDI